MSVCAVVVTRDRRALLRSCLQAVQAQTRPVDAVLVLDNASTDGSPAMVRAEFPEAQLRVLPANEGSAGGFHEGMAWALELGFEWLWVMDDDTIPRPDCLQHLLEADIAGAGLAPPVLLSSKVLWTDGSLHPMNVQGYDMSDPDVFVASVEAGFPRVRYATFPSLLVHRGAVERHGPPRKAYFLWSDDIDFTGRILRHEAGYVVPGSIAVHETATAHSPWEGGPRFYFAVRNGLRLLLRSDALRPKEKVGWTLLVLEQVRRFVVHERGRPSCWLVLARGVRDGLLGRQGPMSSR